MKTFNETAGMHRQPRDRRCYYETDSKTCPIFGGADELLTILQAHAYARELLTMRDRIDAILGEHSAA